MGNRLTSGVIFPQGVLISLGIFRENSNYMMFSQSLKINPKFKEANLKNFIYLHFMDLILY